MKLAVTWALAAWLGVLTSSLKATPSAWNPRGPSSPCSLVMTLESAWQCGQVVNMNAIITTLPRWLESRSCFPDGRMIVNSLLGRGTGAAAWSAGKSRASSAETVAMRMV